jgi:type II secretory pathway component GspD/PulD (secretin)
MRTSWLSQVLAVLSLTAAAATHTAETPDFKTYDIGYTDGSNAVAVVRSILGEDAKVFYDPATRQLMVLATSNRQVLAEKIIKQIHVPPRNVRVEVAFRGRGQNSRQVASVSGQGAVALDNGGSRTSVRIQPRLENSRTETTSTTLQQLLVSSGRQASIFVGEDVPYIEWLMEYGRRYHYIEQRIVWQRVGAYLIIEPTVIGAGPLIRIRLTPELSGRVDNNPYRTRFANVTTEVTVSDGVPFTLGGLAQENEFFSRFLIGVDRSGARQNLDIELTAHIVDPAGPPK